MARTASGKDRRWFGDADTPNPPFKFYGVEPLPVFPHPLYTQVERARAAGWDEERLRELEEVMAIATRCRPRECTVFQVDEWARVITDKYGTAKRAALLATVSRGGVSLDVAPGRPFPRDRVVLPNHPGWYLAGEWAMEAFEAAVAAGDYATWPAGAPLPWFVSPLNAILYHTTPEGEAAREAQDAKYRNLAKNMAQKDLREARGAGEPTGAAFAPRVKGLKFRDVRKVRIIHDLRSYNDRGDVWSFQLTGLMVFVDALRPGDWMWSRDLKGAYRQWEVDAETRAALGVVVNGRVYVDCKIPFGAKLSPYQFTACLGRPLQWLASENCLRDGLDASISAYLDDFYGCERTEARAGQQAGQFELAARSLKAVIAEEKSEGPTQCLARLLGMTIDTRNGVVIVSCPADKLDKIRAIVAKAREEGELTRRLIDRLVGKIGSVAVGVRGARWFSASLFRWRGELAAAGIGNDGEPVGLPDELKDDLEFWEIFVKQWNGRERMPQPCGVPVEYQCVASDASGDGDRTLAIAWFGKVWWWRSEGAAVEEDIAWLEFLAHAVLHMCCAAVFPKQSVEALIDNTAAQAWFTKGRSKRVRENGVGRRMDRALAVAGTRVVVGRVASEENVLADSGTREALRAGGAYQRGIVAFWTHLPVDRPAWWPAGYEYGGPGALSEAHRGEAIRDTEEYLRTGVAPQSGDGVEALECLLQRLRLQLGGR